MFERGPGRIVVTGAAGLLGSEFVGRAGARGLDVVGLDRSALDVTDEAAVERTLASLGPAWVIHCAAYTAVDRAEEEPEVAMRVNRDGTRAVAAAAARLGSRLVHISSDYVFGGRARARGQDGPYAVDEPLDACGAYAASKAAGEASVASARGHALIVRTGWLYGSGGRNFVTTIVDYARRQGAVRVVDDQLGRPTWVRNLADVVLDLMALGESGVWHVADGGTATWRDLAQEAIRIAAVQAEVTGVSTEAWGAAAPRPRYSVLDLAATEARLGRAMTAWPDALRTFLEQT
jgi:dTDP-4-dehydrorhamnose reductase